MESGQVGEWPVGTYQPWTEDLGASRGLPRDQQTTSGVFWSTLHLHHLHHAYVYVTAASP